MDFPDDGLYAFCRTYGADDSTAPAATTTDSGSASTAAAAETTATSTCLVQVLRNHAIDEKPHSSQLEVQLPHNVVDLAKLDDSQHIVTCFESKLAVLKCTKSTDGFLGSVESTVLFEDSESNDTAFHLVSCRPHHASALVAGNYFMISLPSSVGRGSSAHFWRSLFLFRFFFCFDFDTSQHRRTFTAFNLMTPLRRCGPHPAGG